MDFTILLSNVVTDESLGLKFFTVSLNDNKKLLLGKIVLPVCGSTLNSGASSSFS